MNFNQDNFWEDEQYGNRGFRNRYEDAYGDYRGGYGPPPLSSMPQPLFGPPPPLLRAPRPMGPPFGMSGKQRREPPAIRYLMRCGMTRSALRNLPKDLLDLIQPEYCGLCGHNFDTFAISRVHYISKNHQKAVKKFLAQYNAMGAQSPNEAPLKSRDLYCEICDVEITSKVHADSHYSGKSHHAVVEGRKNPKNPVLLQPGMQRRLQQLIRRERKFLTNKPALESQETATKESKSQIPELYCDICKTSVTCSEQMTAHLNGKKHLSREKQHILKAMRGEIEDETVNNAEDVADDAEDYCADNNVEAGEDAEEINFEEL